MIVCAIDHFVNHSTCSSVAESRIILLGDQILLQGRRFGRKLMSCREKRKQEGRKRVEGRKENSRMF